MKPAIRKTSALRAMRVATIFTGAAAAAVAFTPTAHAAQADGKGGRTVTHGPLNRSGRERPMDNWGKVSGNIVESYGPDCEPHRTHISGTRSRLTGPYHSNMCFGNRGTFDTSSGFLHRPTAILGECGGNNWGWLNSNYASAQSFREGKTYRFENSYRLNSITINGWSGTDNC
jgi:hypothetical protein